MHAWRVIVLGGLLSLGCSGTTDAAARVGGGTGGLEVLDGAVQSSAGGARANGGTGATGGTGGAAGGSSGGTGGPGDGGGPSGGTGAALADAGRPDAGRVISTGDAGMSRIPDGAMSSDAAAVCECSSGPCCDGCHFVPRNWRCTADTAALDGLEVVRAASCGQAELHCSTDLSILPTRRLQDRMVLDYGITWCSGTSSACDGRSEDNTKQVVSYCAVGTACVIVGAPAGASCEPCGDAAP
jgi:hypothetical protein